MILSILICSLEERKAQLNELISNLSRQLNVFELVEQVEIICETDNRQVTTGEKRNKLLQRAKGIYSVFIDDDDTVSEDYVSSILEAAKSSPDCITFNGYMTTNGANKRPFDIGLGKPYREALIDGQLWYLRFPNHITPMKTEIARSVQFQDITFGEDYRWSKEINDRGLLKTEVKINKELYHYVFRTGKK